MTNPETAALARIRQMTDHWEQNLPEVIRTPAVVSALRAALESAAVPVSSPPTGRAALRDRIAEAVERLYETGAVYALGAGEAGRIADAVLAVLPEPADRAGGWLDAAAECNKAGGAYAERGAHDAAGAAFALMEKFLMEAGKAEYVATPCSAPDYCEDGGEPCSVHERLMGHAEGDHELCAPDCGEPWMRRMADETATDQPAAGQIRTVSNDCCGAVPPQDGTWGDCWCTLPPGHDGAHQCQPCTDRNGAPDWTDEPSAGAGQDGAQS